MARCCRALWAAAFLFVFLTLGALSEEHDVQSLEGDGAELHEAVQEGERRLPDGARSVISTTPVPTERSPPRFGAAKHRRIRLSEPLRRR